MAGVFDMKSLKSALPDENGKINPGENFDHFFDVPVAISGNETDLEKITDFKEMGFNEILLDNIRQAKYQRPLPIQENAIPYILNGRDVMGHSMTGSGKTAAYILPLLELLSRDTDMNGEKLANQAICSVQPRAVVLLPTRELANQVQEEFVKLSAGMGLKIRMVYGGSRDSIPEQLVALQKGCDILVGTPGRLMNFTKRDQVCMAKCEYLVLDEADRMLDMNFEPQIRFIVERGRMRPKNERQTLLFSATYPLKVQQLCDDFLENRIFIQVGEIGAANSDILQELIKTQDYEKFDKLLEIVKEQLSIDPPTDDEPWTKKILVFVRTRNTAKETEEHLRLRQLPVTAIHSDMQQYEREFALEKFKNGTYPIMVSTSIAARGLDIKGVDMVINYDLPAQISDYVQRIGRTGRLGNRGRAIAFIDSKFKKNRFGKDLLEILKKAGVANPDQTIPYWFLEMMGATQGPRFMDADF